MAYDLLSGRDATASRYLGMIMRRGTHLTHGSLLCRGSRFLNHERPCLWLGGITDGEYRTFISVRLGLRTLLLGFADSQNDRLVLTTSSTEKFQRIDRWFHVVYPNYLDSRGCHCQRDAQCACCPVRTRVSQNLSDKAFARVPNQNRTSCFMESGGIFQ